MPDKTIAIFGTGRCTHDSKVYETAFQTGFELAKAGFTIANGGYDGSMTASAKGARQANGKTIGVTCAAFGPKPPNKYITDEIRVPTLDNRLDALIELGAAYIVLPGGTGTLLELAKVWELKNKHFLNSKKMIILIGDFWQPLIKLVKTDDPKSCRAIKLVSTPDQIPALLKENEI